MIMLSIFSKLAATKLLQTSPTSLRALSTSSLSSSHVLPKPINVVLIHPDIPGNTGSIGRIVMAVGGKLHLVHPLGFDLSEKSLKRAGLDYWSKLDVYEHSSWEDFKSYASSEPENTKTAWLFTTKASGRAHWDGVYQPGDYLLFGSETKGASEDVHNWVTTRHSRLMGGEDEYGDGRICLPMVEEARSINLACAASAGIFEAVRQCHNVGK